MNVTASPRAVDLIRRSGGAVYVWADRKVCCGGTRFVRASLRAPRQPGAGSFDRVEAGLFVLHFRGAGGKRPDRLRVEVRGRRRPRVEASWDGCAFVV